MITCAIVGAMGVACTPAPRPHRLPHRFTKPIALPAGMIAKAGEISFLNGPDEPNGHRVYLINRTEQNLLLGVNDILPLVVRQVMDEHGRFIDEPPDRYVFICGNALVPSTVLPPDRMLSWVIRRPDTTRRATIRFRLGPGSGLVTEPRLGAYDATRFQPP